VSELDPILDSLFQAPFAPAPSLGQLERRRVQRRRRRMNTRLAAAALAVVAVIAASLTNRAGRHTVNTIDGGNRTPTTVPSTPPAPGAAPGEQGAGPIAGTSSDSNATATPSVSAPLPADSTTTTPGSAGCAAESQPDAVDVTTPAGGAGLGGKMRTCDFTATQAGGYVAHGTWEVEVYRGNKRQGYSNDYGQKYACAPVGTIQPGDHVVLTLTYSSDAAADPQYVRAGPDQHC
jgi:hypothetical protein